MMVALPAITATFTTFLIGGVSDRIGRRKPFMTWGYLFWALTVALFGFISPSSFRSVSLAAISVVALDCIMTFFGSAANDAVFNAYITENVPGEKRSKVEGVIQILPMVAMLFVFGVMDGFTLLLESWPFQPFPPSSSSMRRRGIVDGKEAFSPPSSMAFFLPQ